MFIEHIVGAKTRRNKIIPVSELSSKQVYDVEAYVSMFPFDKGIYDHVRIKKTVSGYEGNYNCRVVWFDIDNEDLEKALSDARDLYNRLVNKYGVLKYHIIIYFSGGKGFHLGLRAAHFGGFESSKDLPYKIGRMVAQITEGIESADTSIYNPNRFFRLPNSKHDKTEYYKIPLSIPDFLHFDLAHILNLAKKPDPEFSFTTIEKVVTNERLKKVWLLSEVAPKTKQEQKVLDAIPESADEKFKLAVKLTQKKYPPENYHGNRNNYMHLLALWCNDLGIGGQGDAEEALELITTHCMDDLQDDPATWDMKNVEQAITGAYKRKSSNWNTKEDYLKVNVSKRQTKETTKFDLMDEVYGMMKYGRLPMKKILRYTRALNATSEKPLPDSEVYKIVEKVCDSRTERKEGDYGYTASDLVAPYIEKITKKRKDVFGLGLPQIDELEKYDYAGKVVAIIGMSGTKKSMLLKEILTNNAMNGERSIYSTMEMTALSQFIRILNKTITSDKYDYHGNLMPADDALREMVKDEKKIPKVTEFLSTQIKKKYEDYLLIDEKGGMSASDYKEYLDMIIKKFGNVSYLGVDGLSMMASSGNEISSAILNSKEIKEVANEYKICIPLLVHVPNGHGREKRQLYDNMRGGAKIGDNVDIMISLSMCRDKTNDYNDEFINDLVYISYWGKRTTGEYREFIMRVNKTTLALEETNLNVDDYN